MSISWTTQSNVQPSTVPPSGLRSAFLGCQNSMMAVLSFVIWNCERRKSAEGAEKWSKVNVHREDPSAEGKHQ